MSAPTLKAPFPYFGGKSSVASAVWLRLGWDVPQYIEPFFGSGACLLSRPNWRADLNVVETVNDKDGMISNFWRAIQAAPDEVAHWADWPVNENDLHARHIWLVNRKFSADFISHLEGDPDYYDAKIAGWWCWGACCWIGGGWCSGNGPHVSIDGKLVHLGNAGRGVNRQLVHLGNAGRGVNRQLVHLGNAGRGVRRKRVHLSDAGRGVNRKRVHLSNAGQGVNRKLVHLGNAGQGENGLSEWFRALQRRLARVRVCSGDWARVVTNGAMMNTAVTTAIFLDPPYSAEADRDATLYAEDDLSIAHDVRRWALESGDHPMRRIALCGYDGEHDALEAHGWERMSWKANGGMGNQSNGRGAANAHREVVWFSPHCLRPERYRQLTFGAAP